VVTISKDSLIEGCATFGDDVFEDDPRSMDMNAVSLKARFRLTLGDDDEEVMFESLSEMSDEFPLEDRFDAESSAVAWNTVWPKLNEALRSCERGASREDLVLLKRFVFSGTTSSLDGPLLPLFPSLCGVEVSAAGRSLFGT
jgi:hypothetical protein